MKETHFIQQNKEKWLDFEKVIQDPNKDPDKLHDVYIQITDDLSHARTFYPSRSVRAYLNGVAQVIFTDIYKQKKSPFSKLRYFFTDELPQVVYVSRWSFFWAIAFFILSFAIGYFSGMKDPDFIRTILGDNYVNMTAENIKSGDPMKVYKESGRFDMTFGIMVNNMWVTLMYFILGIFAGIGSVVMMMYNGIMLGSFLQYFAQNNLLQEANLTVWMHGTFEISAIIIGTAAGITLGRGLLFPGTYTRLQAFQMSARRAIKIMIGVMVMLFFAAIVEGNLTRHTELGDAFRAVFIASNLAVLLFYFGWYPFYKAKKGFKAPLKEAHLPLDNFYKVDFYKIKNSGEIFNDSFIFFKRYLKQYLLTATALAALFCLIVFSFSSDSPNETFKLETSIFTQVEVIIQFFSNGRVPFMPYLNGFVYAVLAFVVFNLMLKNESDVHKPDFVADIQTKHHIISFLKIWAVSTLLMLWAATDGLWLFLFFCAVLPFMGLWLFLMYRNGFNLLNGVRHAWWLMGSGVGLSYSAHYVMLVLVYLFFSVINSGLLYFYLMFIGWNMSFMGQTQLDEMAVVIMTFVASFTIFINYMLFFTAYGFLYYSLLEINEANSLLEKIKQIGISKKIQGLARE
jgi:uncharacterized membrane protein SpoIIM required for sporulation